MEGLLFTGQVHTYSPEPPSQQTDTAGLTNISQKGKHSWCQRPPTSPPPSSLEVPGGFQDRKQRRLRKQDGQL